MEAAAALANIGPDAKEALPTLEGMKDDGDECVRLAAVAAIPRIRGEDDKAVAALVEGVKSEKTRYYAIRALGDLGPQAQGAAPALGEHLPDATEALWRVTGDPTASVQSLLQNRQVAAELTTSAERARAAYRLSCMGRAASEALDWIRRGTGNMYGHDVAEMEMAYWKIRGIESPPGDDYHDRW